MALTPTVVDWNGAALDRTEGGAFRKGDKLFATQLPAWDRD
jgi:hypothetical protein